MSERIKPGSMTVDQFIDELASGSPTPGGGAVSALAGAIGASLSVMVANLTIGRPKFKESEAAMAEVLRRSEEARKQLSSLVEADMQSFDDVMKAYGLPRETPAQSEARKKAVQSALKGACRCPLKVMRLCDECLELAETAAVKGNPNALSDAGVAGLMLRAAVEGAGYNVLINVSGITDDGFRQSTLEEHRSILTNADSIWLRIKAAVERGVMR